MTILNNPSNMRVRVLALLSILLLISVNVQSFTFIPHSQQCLYLTRPLSRTSLSSSNRVAVHALLKDHIQPDDTPSSTPTASIPTQDTNDPSESRIINFLPSALNRIKELIQAEHQKIPTPSPLSSSYASSDPTVTILRMGVKSGGCSGMSYTMNFIDSSKITTSDHVEPPLLSLPGLKVIIDPMSLLYLVGMSLDYSDSMIGGGFLFMNPNSKEGCGCGKSFGV